MCKPWPHTAIDHISPQSLFHFLCINNRVKTDAHNCFVLYKILRSTLSVIPIKFMVIDATISQFWILRSIECYSHLCLWIIQHELQQQSLSWLERQNEQPFFIYHYIWYIITNYISSSENSEKKVNPSATNWTTKNKMMGLFVIVSLYLFRC